MLKGKNIVIGVTGSIAAYKTASLASMLFKLHANVNVIMTKNACNFINPITFDTLTKNKCITDTFDRDHEFSTEHISLAKSADLFIVAPASANFIGKLANGILDDMLLTTIFAFKGKVLIAPAMNTAMYENPILQENIEKLKRLGYIFVEPDYGMLACGDIGKGKMPEPEILLQNILRYILKEDFFNGKNFLITAGRTEEALDPVRYISNHSSGKMGYAIAKWALIYGANVTLISGPSNLIPFDGIDIINVKSANDMFNKVKELYNDFDYIIMASAVADYTPINYSDNKIKKNDSNLYIELKRTTDILKFLGENKKENQKIIGFSMETENLIESSKAKLLKKNADMICANTIGNNNTGFNVDTNLVTLITKNDVIELPFGTKDNVAQNILKYIKDNNI